MLPGTKKILDALNTDLDRLSDTDDPDFQYLQVRAIYLTALATIVVAADIESLAKTLKNLDSIKEPTHISTKVGS